MRSSFVVLTAFALVACEKKEAPPTPSAPATSSSSVASMKGSALGVPPCRSDQTITSAHGRTSSCILVAEFSLDGYVCAAGKQIEIHPSGKLKGCSLREPRTVDDWSCQDGMTLYPSGRLRRCKVTAARRIEPAVDVRPGDWVTLYEGAGLKRLELAVGPNTIQGYPCKGYLNFFHESGRLKKCELESDMTIEGQRVSWRTTSGAPVYVCFDAKGKRVADCATLSGMTLD
jgi:hypothetical protein